MAKTWLCKGWIGVFLLVFVRNTLGQDAPQDSLRQLETRIQMTEQQVPGLKPRNEAHIIWDREHPYSRSNLVFLYLHGFGACSREGQPVMDSLCNEFHANAYMPRLYEHGIDRKDAYKNLTEEKYLESAMDALAIAKQLGDTVVVVGTSTGASLALTLASEDKCIKALVLYSPFIELYNKKGYIITSAWGRFLFWVANFGWVQHQNRQGEIAQYWSSTYHVNAFHSLINMVEHHMNDSCFANVHCPVFLGYYYKNEEEQDHVVSVKAAQRMFTKLGSSPDVKQEVAFPLAGDHVIGCDLRSKDWQSVYHQTSNFIHAVLQK